MTESPDVPTSDPTGSRSFVERLTGALMLDASVYDEVEHDESAMGQAAGVVALGAVASGIGAMSGAGMGGVIGGVLMAFVFWALGAAVVWLVGVRMMEHTSDFPELLRTLGFASAPQILAIVGVIPLLGSVSRGAAFILSLIAWIIAVRQALDVETGRAVLVCVLAYLAQAAILGLLAVMGIGIFAVASA